MGLIDAAKEMYKKNAGKIEFLKILITSSLAVYSFILASDSYDPQGVDYAVR